MQLCGVLGEVGLHRSGVAAKHVERPSALSADPSEVFTTSLGGASAWSSAASMLSN
jgi:hypothetical protein